MKIQAGGRGIKDDGWIRFGRNTYEYQRRPTGTCWDSFKGKGKGTEEKTTIFFTHFPDSYDAKEMINIFKNYGILDEVVIPLKRDNRDDK